MKDCQLGIPKQKVKEIEVLKAELKTLARNAKIVLDSVNSGDYIPEFRYTNLRESIVSARKRCG